MIACVVEYLALENICAYETSIIIEAWAYISTDQGNMSLYGRGDSHWGDKPEQISSYLHNDNRCYGK